MAKRRKTAKKSAEPQVPSKKKKPRVHMDSMDVPNHAVPFGMTKKLGASRYSTQKYPLMHLALAEPGSGAAKTLAFVDERYGLIKWVDRDIDAPPTWMDPEVFVRQLWADPRVKQLCDDYVRKRTSGKRTRLNDLVQELFEQEYLVYALEQFATVRHLITDWLVAYTAYRRSE